MQTVRQQPPSAPPAQARRPAARQVRRAAPARARRRPRQSVAAKFTEVCAGCHGTSRPGPVGPSLLADEWIHGSDDESIAKNIRDGFLEKGMPPFKDALTDQEIWQMVAYLRTQTANLKDKPVYVPDPDGQVIKSEKQTFKMEIVARNLETPWGLAFLPDGRLLITERPGRLRIVDKDGKLLPEPVKGTPKVWEKQDGGLLDVEVHPQYARNGWIYISYSETLPGYVAPPPPPPPSAGAAAAAAAGGGGRGRGGPPDPPSMTVIVRGKINKNNEWVDQQVLFRAPTELYNSSNAHYGSRFLFDKQNHLFFSLGEKQQMAERAGSVEADRQDPPRSTTTARCRRTTRS